MFGVCKDMITTVVTVCFNPNGPSMIKETLDKVKTTKLVEFEKVLSNKTFLVGSGLTYADLFLMHIGQMMTALDENVLNDFPNIKAHQEKIMSIDTIKAFYASDKCQKNMLPPSSSIKI